MIYSFSSILNLVWRNNILNFSSRQGNEMYASISWCTSTMFVNTIVNDDQKDATVLDYLSTLNYLYIFRAMSSPIIRSTWLYLQLLVMSTDVAAGWCHGWDGTAVPSRRWHQPAAIPVDNIRCCKYSHVLLMMGENIARNM